MPQAQIPNALAQLKLGIVGKGADLVNFDGKTITPEDVLATGDVGAEGVFYLGPDTTSLSVSSNSGLSAVWNFGGTADGNPLGLNIGNNTYGFKGTVVGIGNVQDGNNSTRSGAIVGRENYTEYGSYCLGDNNTNFRQRNLIIGQGNDGSGGSFDMIVIANNQSNLERYDGVIGNTMTRLYIGSGKYHADAGSKDVLLSATMGLGNNVGGSDLKIAGGRGTGTASGGDIIFYSCGAGSSGGSLNGYDEAMRIDGETGKVTISGDFEVLSTGTETILNTQTLSIEDNIIELGRGQVTGVLDLGLDGNRGSDPNAQLKWLEASDYWACGTVGDMKRIVREGESGVLDHGLLAGLGDDDHTQYLNTTRHAALNHSFVDHGTIAGLGDDDHSQYILVSGARAFTSTVSGVTPTASAHLATKGYVDSVSGGSAPSFDSACVTQESSTDEAIQTLSETDIGTSDSKYFGTIRAYITDLTEKEAVGVNLTFSLSGLYLRLSGTAIPNLISVNSSFTFTYDTQSSNILLRSSTSWVGLTFSLGSINGFTKDFAVEYRKVTDDQIQFRVREISPSASADSGIEVHFLNLD